MASEMEGALRSRIEGLVRAVAATWPVQSDGICRFCGHVSWLPSPRTEPSEAVEMLTSAKHHGLSCPWAEAREIVRLLG